MKYTSTRNNSISIPSREAIIQGISEDGGLFVPEAIPQIDDIEKLITMDYKELAYEIMSQFLTDFPPHLLKDCIEKAYNDKFTEGIVPLVDVGDLCFLELFHGPTLAFKDMALSILPHLLKTAMDMNTSDKEVVILTATSGDTGKAALEGFAGVEGIKIVVFYPENGVSEIQKRQMITQEGDNTFVIGIKGNFDDAQSGVKKLFNDPEFAKTMGANNYTLSSANSINIGRLIPQIVYYFHGYVSLRRQGKIQKGDKINIAVPTGNFGNILAAYYGKSMGLPVNRLICASNENNILSDFINTNIYDARRELILTSSPSMDILISSNLERLLFHLSNEDSDLIKESMERLAEKGVYEMHNINIEDFFGAYADEEEVTNGIDQVFKKKDYLMDPHTAVAYNIYEKYRLATKDKTKTILSATASPFKFGAKVAESIGMDIDKMEEFAILKALAKETSSQLPEAIKALEEKPIRHKNICNKDAMKEMLEDILNLK